MKRDIKMQDNLKEHIDNNREAFEVFDFDVEQGWEDLSTAMPTPKTSFLWKWAMSIAASVLLLGVFVFSQLGFGRTGNSELTEAEFYYEQMIDAKMIQVKQKVKDPILLADIEHLDQAFLELKRDLKDDLANEEVILAMMENYQLKLKILERILEEIEEDEKDKDTTISL